MGISKNCSRKRNIEIIYFAFVYCLEPSLEWKLMHLFLEHFQVHRKMGKVQKFPVCPLTPHMHSLPHFKLFHPNGTFVVVTTLPHHQKTKYIVYISVYSWWCTFCPPLQCQIESFHYINILCALPVHSSLSLNSWQSLISLLPSQCCLFQNVTYVVESYSMQPFQRSLYTQ